MYWSGMRESHPLGPEGSGFTDRRPYFKALIPEICNTYAEHPIATLSACGISIPVSIVTVASRI